jgi:hypothetical protein
MPLKSKQGGGQKKNVAAVALNISLSSQKRRKKIIIMPREIYKVVGMSKMEE